MKKSLKALILCGLASLMILTAVFASPVSVKAVPSTLSGSITLPSVEIYDSNSNLAAIINTPVQIDFEYPYGRDPYTIDQYAFGLVPGEFMYIYVNFDNTDPNVLNASDLQNVIANYSFSYNGVSYSGPTELTFYGGYAWAYYKWSDSGNDTGYGKVINDLKNQISNISNDSTLTGENRVIEFNEGDALPKSVIASLANSTGVTLKFTFVYEGYEFCTTITSEDAKRVYDSKVEWAGPCYLANNFPTVWTGKTVK